MKNQYDRNFDKPQLVKRKKTSRIASNKDKIKKEAIERSKKQPILQKIIKWFQKEKTFRELIINGTLREKRVALLEDGILENFLTENDSDQRMVGAIFKGKIQNLEPGLKAAFVDIGMEKNAFLHYWDILPSLNGENVTELEDKEQVDIVRNNVAEKKKEVTLEDIPSLYPIGEDIVVQITKSQIGTKGPRTTTNISLPGRYLVLTPYSSQCGISRKVVDSERKRLAKILRKLVLPKGMGVIIRTAGIGKKYKYFIRDLHLLLKKWEQIQEKVKSANGPCIVYQEPKLLERSVRDFLTEDIDRIIVDNEKDYSDILSTLKDIAPSHQNKIVHFKDSVPVFERFNVEKQIEQTFCKYSPLPSGGEIVIEETEALTAIDINTSSHKGKIKDGTDFILQANLEAAKEIVRQIRLRNIGGLIIVDFIDMKSLKDRKLVHGFMQEEMSKDKEKTHVLPISSLGIMQISRQRHRESFLSRFYSKCPYCNGEGHIKSPRNINLEIQRNLISQIIKSKSDDSQIASIEVTVNPIVYQYIRSYGMKDIKELSENWNVSINLSEKKELHSEDFIIKTY